MAAIYKCLQFRTRLEARWAAFFDLAGWAWHVNPLPVGDWAPDFQVTFACEHAKCATSHTLLIAVLPHQDIGAFSGHPSLDYPCGAGAAYEKLGAVIDAGAAFGVSPEVTSWTFAHSAEGCAEDVLLWVANADALWSRAEFLVY